MMNILGRKWNYKILLAIFLEKNHFNEILEFNSELSSKVLSNKLKDLMKLEIIEKRVENSTPVEITYHLTEKGYGLKQIIAEIYTFGFQNFPHLMNEFEIQLSLIFKEYQGDARSLTDTMIKKRLGSILDSLID